MIRQHACSVSVEEPDAPGTAAKSLEGRTVSFSIERYKERLSALKAPRRDMREAGFGWALGGYDSVPVLAQDRVGAR